MARSCVTPAAQWQMAATCLEHGIKCQSAGLGVELGAEEVAGGVLACSQCWLVLAVPGAISFAQLNLSCFDVSSCPAIARRSVGPMFPRAFSFLFLQLAALGNLWRRRWKVWDNLHKTTSMKGQSVRIEKKSG